MLLFFTISTFHAPPPPASLSSSFRIFGEKPAAILTNVPGGKVLAVPHQLLSGFSVSFSQRFLDPVVWCLSLILENFPLISL